MQIYEDWNGHNVKLTWMPNHVLSSEKIITSVHGICLYEGLVLLVNIKGRGFNYPGGHIEDGESPLNALHREVYEEGYVKGEATYIGAIEVSHENNSLYEPEGNYPFIGYQAFYQLEVKQRLPFLREHEATGRIWVEPNLVSSVITDHAIAKRIVGEL